MTIRNIHIDQLLVNSANDRHGELADESAAIAWLFNNFEGRMRNLAKDIAHEGEIYEVPLVWPVPNKKSYVVHDGNRRITCLKLLHHPDKAPTVELQSFFRKIASDAVDLPVAVRCDFEPDRDRIDRILYRRHTGSQSGVGQAKWDDRMTATFVERTGKGTGVSSADEIERVLNDEGALRSRKKIPRSTLNRLCSSEAFRNRLGFTMKGGSFAFTHDHSKVIKALSRVAFDVAEKRITLNDVWDNKSKHSYLDELERNGHLPSAHDTLSRPLVKSSANKAKQKDSTKASARTNSPRTTLIRPDDDGPAWVADTQRHRDIWDELQGSLRLNDHKNAISVLLRVLIEISVKHYAKQHRVEYHNNDKLQNLILKVAHDLFEKGHIDKHYFESIKTISHDDKIVSTKTMNQFVHSTQFNPSPDHLTSIWDNFRPLVVECLDR